MGEGGDRLGIKAVALFEAVGDVGGDVGPGLFEGVVQDGRGGDAVDVVVAVGSGVCRRVSMGVRARGMGLG